MGFLDVLNVRLETAHTKLLAWLLSPTGDHGLGSAVLQGFCRRAINTSRGMKGAKVTAEASEDESRSDITIVSAEHYVLVENKIKHSAYSPNQLHAHVRSVTARCKKTGRQPTVVLIVPDSSRLSCPELPSELDPRICKRMDWREVVGLLREAQKRAPANASGRPFITAYIDFIEREVVGMWKGFGREFLQDDVVKAVALYGSKMASIEWELRAFSDAVNLELSLPRQRSGGSLRGAKANPYGNEAIQVFKRTWKLNKSGSDLLILALYVEPEAKSRSKADLWIEMVVNSPSIVTRGRKRGLTDTKTVRRMFGPSTWADPDDDNLYVATRVSARSWQAFGATGARRSARQVAKLVSTYWDKYDEC